MSDYLDYENNLAFDPTSADDLNKQGRQSDVLVAALDKCEMLEKQLEIAVKALELARDTAYSSTQDCPKCVFIDERLSEALAKIKELDK